MLKKRDQKGFTLIEIIAVLVILGILAAVAIPKYMNLQRDAHGKALSGAVAALQSTATMDYSKGLLNGLYSSTNGPTDATNAVVGDFNGSYSTASNVTTVTVTGGPSGWNDYDTAAYNATKTFTLR